MQPRFTSRRVRAPRCGMVAALLGALLLATFSATSVGAANFAVTVDHTADDTNGCATTGAGPCSLRDAIAYANTHTGASDLTTITVPTHLTPYALTARLNITANLTINGGGASTTVINGAAADRIISIFTGTTVTLNDLTLSNGHATSFAAGGGAIYTAGATTLNRCVVSNNVANLPGGGIVSAAGTLAFSASVVSNNSAVGSGGGVYSSGGALTVTNSQFTANQVTGAAGSPGGTSSIGGPGASATGGAIAVASASSFSVTGSSFTGNSVTGGDGGDGGRSSPGGNGGTGGTGGDATGGAIAIAATNSFSITRSVFTGNSAIGGTGGAGGSVGPFGSNESVGDGGLGGTASGGAVSNGSGTLTLTNSTFTTNRATGGFGGVSDFAGGGGGGGGVGAGGAMFNGGGTLTVTNSTFTTNQATGGGGGGGGGGMHNGGNGGNGGTGTGGAVSNAGSSVIVNATIAANSASGGGGGMGGNFLGPPGQNGTNGVVGGGGLTNTGSNLRVVNTLLSANTGGTTANCSAITDGGHNLEFSPTTTCGFATSSPKFDVLADPKLDTLKDNGGPTQTMALLTGSAAIDTADPAACAAPPAVPTGAASARSRPMSPSRTRCHCRRAPARPPLACRIRSPRHHAPCLAVVAVPRTRSPYPAASGRFDDFPCLSRRQRFVGAMLESPFAATGRAVREPDDLGRAVHEPPLRNDDRV